MTSRFPSQQNKQMTKKYSSSLATTLIKWLTTALLAAALAACGSSDSGPSVADIAVSKTVGSNSGNDTQSIKGGIQLPKFQEVKFSPFVSGTAKIIAPVLKAANQSGLVGAYLYPQYIWNSHRINVCWENPSDWDKTEREWAKEAVTSTWDANSDVTFVDWSTCPEYDESNPYLGVRAFITSGRPITRAPGEAGIGFRNNIQLNFDFSSFAGDCSYTSMKQICVKNEAVHEFGHVLAFIHEQDRPDTPAACIDEVLASEPTYLFRKDGAVSGPWDAESIMNYCAPGIYAYYRDLSAGDITMVQKYYGKPGSKIYSVFTANDPPIVSIQDSKTFEDVADYLTIPNAQDSVLRHFYATPDGNKIAYTLVNRQNGSILGYIDTHSDTLKGQKTIVEEVVDMKLSGDSKYAYVVWKQGTSGGLRAYDLSTLTVAWNLPLAGAKQIVEPRNTSGQQLYIVVNSGVGSAQSVAVVNVNSHTQISSFSVGTARSRPLVAGLTPDEKTLYIADPGADNQAPFMAELDTQSGRYSELQPISPADADVHDLHVLDSNQVLLGTKKKGLAPLIYTVATKTFSAITGGIPSDWSLPYVYSPDGKTVFTMGQYWDDNIPYYSSIRLDSYRPNYASGPVVWDGSDHPVWSVGFRQDVVTRPFALIYR
ncbi:putative carbohydrate-binding protein [Caballeronia sordidicola]|uniref:Putative carbohydrate-binding protein n=2 Tax=Caballeronia sordidicola TaxID=196367 RepID=A0A242N6A8_CABSO|nr:putative carbohydrate-binding protein [Caballeronia sordidicola]